MHWWYDWRNTIWYSANTSKHKCDDTEREYPMLFSIASYHREAFVYPPPQTSFCCVATIVYSYVISTTISCVIQQSSRCTLLYRWETNLCCLATIIIHSCYYYENTLCYSTNHRNTFLYRWEINIDRHTFMLLLPEYEMLFVYTLVSLHRTPYVGQQSWWCWRARYTEQILQSYYC